MKIATFDLQRLCPSCLQAQYLRVPSTRSHVFGCGHERVYVLEELLGRPLPYRIDPVGQN